MALTAYQTQFKRRMKRAIKLRARADAKARRYTQLLADAIGVAEDAAAQMNALNQLYNVDVSTYTLLTQALHANDGRAVLADHLAASTPGEEVVLFNQVPDGNSGQLLPENPLFGEVVTGTPVVVANPPASAQAAGIVVSQLRAEDAGNGNWRVTVEASAPSGQYHVANDFAPYAYDLLNGHETVFFFNEAPVGQLVNFVFTDLANPQLREERTLTLS